MAPSTIPTATPLGTGGTTDLHTAQLQIREVAKKVSMLFPDESPFVTLTSRTAKATIGKSREHEIFYQKDWPRTITVNASTAADATSVTVVSSAGIQKHRTLHDPQTGEQIIINTVTSSTALAITRNSAILPGESPRALVAGDVLVVGSVGQKEGATAVEATTILPTRDYNYYQQFEQAWAVTDISAAIDTYHGDPRAYQEMMNMREYRKQINRAGLIGIRDLNASAGGSDMSVSGGIYGHRYCGGIQDFVYNYNSGANVLEVGGAFTFDELDAFLEDRSRPVKRKKFWMFCGSQVASIMNYWPVQYHQADHQNKNSFGFKCKRFFGISWELEVYYDELFNTNGYYDQFAIVNADTETIRQLTNVKLPDKINRGIIAPDLDGTHIYKDQVSGLHTFEIQPYAHMWGTGATS